MILAAFAISQCLEERPPLPETSFETCTLTTVIDGDSVRCEDGREIRLLSIDAPEIAQDPWGHAAREALLALAPPGVELGVEYDVERRDDFGRDLAYLYLSGGDLLNERMVAEGYALAFVIAPNRRYADRIRRAERAAESAGLGLWARGGFACRPVDFRQGRCGP